MFRFSVAMKNITSLYYKYMPEHVELMPGIFSDFDAKILYSFVRETKPCNILDCAPREGKTTSAIIQALIKNSSEHPQDINYFIFEKDPSYFDEMKMFHVSDVTHIDVNPSQIFSPNTSLIPFVNQLLTVH